jgi:sigma-B regulation protein RsbU (phosphoserine phosphatase)
VNRLVRPAAIALLLAATSAIVAAPSRDWTWDVARTAARHAPPDPSTRWHPDLDGDGQSDLWHRTHLPSTPPAAPHLVFRAYVSEITVFVGERRVYAFEDAEASGRLTVHVVALGDARGGEVLYLHTPRAPDAPLFSTLMLVGSGAVPAAIRETSYGPLRDDISDLALGLLLGAVALIALLASGISRRGNVRALRYFGTFTLLYGARLLTDSFLPLALGGTLLAAEYATAVITYVITVPAWLLSLELIGRGWRSSLRWQVVAFAVFAPVGIITDILTRTPASLDTLNSVLVIVGGVNILANLVAAQRRGTVELRVILAGSVAFLLFALVNNFAALGLIDGDHGDETVGFLLFVGALGFAATRAFIRGEREHVSIQRELETAREIQRSILPTSMPSIEGLRVEAGYVPVSSVGGDMYDFRQDDASRCGILVADVAGHGVPAALVASMVKIAVSAQSHLASDPAAMMSELNRTLRREVRRAFVTATYLWVDMEARSVTVCNGGHPAPLLLRDGSFRELGTSGVLLGRFASLAYSAETVPLRPGDRIVAITDGIVEARDASDVLFGEERLRELLLESSSRDAREVVSAILENVQRWRGAESEDADDLTLIVLDVV